MRPIYVGPWIQYYFLEHIRPSGPVDKSQKYKYQKKAFPRKLLECVFFYQI